MRAPYFVACCCQKDQGGPPSPFVSLSRADLSSLFSLAPAPQPRPPPGGGCAAPWGAGPGRATRPEPPACRHLRAGPARCWHGAALSPLFRDWNTTWLCPDKYKVTQKRPKSTRARLAPTQSRSVTRCTQHSPAGWLARKKLRELLCEGLSWGSSFPAGHYLEFPSSRSWGPGLINAIHPWQGVLH